jgi:GT2 family glycosyltransferase
MRIAFLMTCHNRAEDTLACLQSIHEQDARATHEIEIVLVDDGSTDGTAEKVRGRFPTVHVLHGGGDLFWAGGMRKAFAYALERGFDHYVWINDDTRLYRTALSSLLNTVEQVHDAGRRAAIVVGATEDPESGTTSYTGWRRTKRWAPGVLEKVEPASTPVQCDTFNGNCVLIPAAVAHNVGNLDPAFTHSMGDLDYGLRARAAHFFVWLAPRHVGACRANPGRGLWTDQALSLRQRWSRMLGPKGLPPREWRAFTHRHHGLMWWVYWLNPYVKFWARGLMQALRRGGGRPAW